MAGLGSGLWTEFRFAPLVFILGSRMKQEQLSGACSSQEDHQCTKLKPSYTNVFIASSHFQCQSKLHGQT